MDLKGLENLLNQCLNEKRSVLLDVRNAGRFQAFVDDWELGASNSWLHVFRLPHPLLEHGKTEKAFFVPLSEIANAESGEQICARIWRKLCSDTLQIGVIQPYDGPRVW